MIERVRATNSIGYEFNFTDVNRIVNGLDLSGLGADVNSIRSLIAGSRYQNTVLKNRTFSIELQLRRLFQEEEAMDEVRANMYRVFNPELNPIKIDFRLTNGDAYYLTAYLLSTPVMGPDKKNNNAAFQKALLQFTATDPFIYQDSESSFELSSYEGGLEFDWEIPIDGDVFEEKTQSFEGTIFYSGTGTEGMTIKIAPTGTVVKPRITNAQTFEFIEVNDTLLNGDEVIITTYRGQRNAQLIRNGVTTNFFSKLTLPDSTFLQLNPGNNSFVYSAQSGVENLSISINYRVRKVGV